MRITGMTLTLLVGCSTSVDEGDVLPTLRIGADAGLASGLLPTLANNHADTRGTVRFEISSQEDGSTLRKLLSGELDLAISSRRPQPNEQEQAGANGYDLDAPDSRHIVGVDVVTLSVHANNHIDSLTYDQVIGIFCTREIDNWSFLGLDEAPIRAMTPEPSSGTRALFEDFFCGPRGIHTDVEVASSVSIANALETEDNVITFQSLSTGAGKTLGLRPDPTGPPVRPSQQNIIRGSYPLYQDINLYTPGEPSGEVKQLVDYVRSPAGQEVVDEERFVPLFLRPERLDEARPLRETIHFEQNATQPNLRSKARLQLLVDEMQDRAGEYQHVVLEGYTDSREGDANALATARAESVRDLLGEELPGLYFEIIPRGAAHPIAPNDTPYGRQRNRRVQIYLAEEEADGQGNVEVVSSE